ncbi:MAG: 50S ribosomal protein L23 [Candidatus Peregrinibacteria bacterium Greene0416_19]|nr:MAG: 50S ribosomal protein L23 [Candidatus Peregrinibacteria bacterium Greene0416_19]
MDLTHVILGPIITEKAERLKAAGPRHTYTMRISPRATKVDVRNALKRFYSAEVDSVRVMWVEPKFRTLGAGSMEKRHAFKKALVTLKAKSKVLDLSSFESHS